MTKENKTDMYAIIGRPEGLFIYNCRTDAELSMGEVCNLLNNSIPRAKVEELIAKWERDSWEYNAYEPEVKIYDKCREELESLLDESGKED